MEANYVQAVRDKRLKLRPKPHHKQSGLLMERAATRNGIKKFQLELASMEIKQENKLVLENEKIQDKFNAFEPISIEKRRYPAN